MHLLAFQQVQRGLGSLCPGVLVRLTGGAARRRVDAVQHLHCHFARIDLSAQPVQPRRRLK
ncbi:hypothetical protein ACFV98_16265 [Streptomyces violascens]|uniref:hypothetical protein n=1 Tax=Streptomyces violascens TaxID=67381 RepID=UPI003665BC6D